MNKEMLSEAIREAGLALLHREIVRHGEVRLQRSDFDAAEAATDVGQAIQLNIGPDGEIIFTHAKADLGQPSS